jgi:hypothetical protein
MLEIIENLQKGVPGRDKTLSLCRMLQHTAACALLAMFGLSAEEPWWLHFEKCSEHLWQRATNCTQKEGSG